MAYGEEVRELSVGLQGFGLTEYESKLYVALLAIGNSSVNQLQFASGIPRTKVYQVALQLVRKGIIKELEGKPIRFEALPPEVFQGALSERERNVRSLKRVVNSLKKVRERNILPQDTVEERYLSFGSQSLLMRLKESILRAQSGVKCIVDTWGLQLIQECSEELETVCRQEVEVLIISSLPSALPTFPFSSPKLKIRFGKHMAGKSAFMVDGSDLIVVNSQTGRGYQLVLPELRSAMGEDLFNEFWKTSISGRTISSIAAHDGLPFFVDPPNVNKLFVEAVSRTIREEKVIGSIGEEFLRLLEEKVSPRLAKEPFDAAVKLILAMLADEMGEETSVDYDPLTKILRMELPGSEGGIPGSAWYFALAGLLKKTEIRSELLHDTMFPEARSRIIQRKLSRQG
jgi:sugar-specific transcriptional regulator TrmB